MTQSYQAVYKQWQADPQGFWAAAAEDIHWYKKWDKVLDDSNAPFYRWFSGAQVNSCYNALDRHVENGRAGQLALIYDSPVTNTVKKFTYAELLDLVARFAGVLRSQGIEKGGGGDVEGYAFAGRLTPTLGALAVHPPDHSGFRRTGRTCSIKPLLCGGRLISGTLDSEFRIVENYVHG